MVDFQKKFDDLMTAVTFAEAGESETAKEFLNDRGKVLFATKETQVDERAVNFAVNICRRIGARLDILFISSNKGLTPKIGKLVEDITSEGISCTLSKRIGCLKNQIIDYVNDDKEILFVVIESSDNLDSDCRRRDKKMHDAWDNLNCPLVVVSEPEKA